MSRLVIENGLQELSEDCSWTDESVKLSSGDIYLDGQPFGTYIAACYPDSCRSPQFIINVLDANGRPLLSLACEYVPNASDPVRLMQPEDSPWSEDGILIGPIPSEPERSIYTRAIDALRVAREFVSVEPNLAAHRGEA